MKIVRSIIAFSLRLVNLTILFVYFTFKVINSGWIVAWLVVKGYRGENETLIEYQPQSDKSWHIILLFNLISMTPGSLSVDLSEDRNIIYVHLLNSNDQDDFVKTTGKIERMLLRSLGNSKTKN
ncbi:MAG: Na+/H+ antiporter subunit E [Bacteroidetes bacterium]|nr:Na+/H+ antiporter subunit E [Bacteroidota bacterium]